tara:strand:+ start:1130 stop:1657 length:528 start_codon:yes stop_codon:yes gene_type:complete
MTKAPEILIIAVSNGENLKLAKNFLKLTQQQQISAEILDLTTLDLPLFNPRTQNNNPNTNEINFLSKKMESINKWIICTPEYNGSIPPLLTNLIAWLSVSEENFRAIFNGRPIAITSFSGGPCLEVLISLRIQLSHLGAQVIGRQLTSNSNKPYNDSSLKDILNRLSNTNKLNID